MPVARGWVAIGALSYGLLLSVGSVACGGIALGGVSFGVISIAGMAIGVFSIGGAAVGLYAVGGLAIGIMALGGAAIGWKAAVGGLAMSGHYALGGSAVGPEANTAAARDFITQSPFFGTAQVWAHYSRWAQLFVLLPVVAVLARRRG